MNRIIGIDLGTTYSAAGVVRDGRPEILPNGSERIMPSVVGFTATATLVLGTPARNQQILYPENTVSSIKRKMGTDEKVRLLDRDYTPTEISALILKEIKRAAEANLGEAVTRAVITVPSFFSDSARQATKDAGELAGLEVLRIINEPTAAALAYGLDRCTEQQLVAVYDLGGGTFDVSIIELNEGVLEVRASHGDTHLGGDDFDEQLVDFLAERFLAKHKVDPRKDRKAHARLTRAAEAAKIVLSSQPFAKIREEYLLEHKGKPLHLDDEISRQDFQHLIHPLLEQTLLAFDQAMADAGLKPGELDKLLFVGGSTRIPLVWEMVAHHTGLEPMVEINPDEAVALGAGVQAAIIDGEPIDTVLVDVTPHSLGIAVAEWHFDQLASDQFAILIHRNTTLPTTRAEVYTTLSPEQTVVQLKVYQGENPVASHNTLLGEFLFEDLKPETKGQPPCVTVEFDLDINGILHVSATDRGSRQVKQTTLHAAHTRLSTADKEASALFLDSLSGGLAEEAEGLPQDAASVDLAMLGKAKALLAKGGDNLVDLAETVAALEKAQSEGRQEDAIALSEEMLDLLYELDEEVGMEHPVSEPEPR